MTNEEYADFYGDYTDFCKKVVRLHSLYKQIQIEFGQCHWPDIRPLPELAVREWVTISNWSDARDNTRDVANWVLETLNLNEEHRVVHVMCGGLELQKMGNFVTNPCFRQELVDWQRKSPEYPENIQNALQNLIDRAKAL